SMVTLRAADVVLLPAASVALALMLCVPSLSVLLVMLQLPLPSAVVVPSTVLPSSNTTALLASAVPEKVGVVTLVLLSVLVLPLSAVPVKAGVVTLLRLSVLELPLSVAAVRSGVAGAAGAAVSMVTLKAADATDVFPARSVCVAVILCTPSLSVLLVTDALPPLATALPTTVAPSKRVTVKPEVRSEEHTAE